MSRYRVMLAVVLSSFLAFAAVSCDQNRNNEQNEKKVEEPAQPPAGQNKQPGTVTPPPAGTITPQPGEGPQQPGQEPPKQEPGGTEQKTQ